MPQEKKTGALRVLKVYAIIVEIPATAVKTTKIPREIARLFPRTAIFSTATAKAKISQTPDVTEAYTKMSLKSVLELA